MLKELGKIITIASLRIIFSFCAAAFFLTGCIPEGQGPNSTSKHPFSTPSLLSLKSAQIYFDEIQHSQTTSSKEELKSRIKGHIDFQLKALDIHKIPREFNIELQLVEIEFSSQAPRRWVIAKQKFSAELLNEKINEPFEFLIENKFPAHLAQMEILFSVRPKNNFRIYGPLFGKIPINLKINSGSRGPMERFKTEKAFEAYCHTFVSDSFEINKIKASANHRPDTAYFKPLSITQAKGHFEKILHSGGANPNSRISGVLDIEVQTYSGQILPGSFDIHLVLIERRNTPEQETWFLAETKLKARLENHRLNFSFEFELKNRLPHDQSAVEILYRINPIHQLNLYGPVSGKITTVLGIPGQINGSSIQRFHQDQEFNDFYQNLKARTSLPPTADPRLRVGGERHGFVITDLKVIQSVATSYVPGTSWPNAYAVFVEVELEDGLKRDQSKTTASHPFEVEFLGQKDQVEPLRNNRFRAGPFILKFDPFGAQQILSRKLKIRSTQFPYFNIEKQLETQLIPWENEIFHYNQSDLRNKKITKPTDHTLPELTMDTLRYGYLGAKEFKVDREMNLIQTRRYFLQLKPNLLRTFRLNGLPIPTPIQKGRYEIHLVLLGRKAGIQGSNARTKDERLTGTASEILSQYQYLGSYQATVQSKNGTLNLDEVAFTFDLKNLVYAASRCTLLAELRPLDGMARLAPYRFTSTFYPMNPSIQIPIYEVDKNPPAIEREFFASKADLEQITKDGELTYLKTSLGSESSIDLFSRISGIPDSNAAQLETLRTYNGRHYPEDRILENFVRSPIRFKNTARNLCLLWDESKIGSERRAHWLNKEDQYRCKKNPFQFFRIDRVFHLIEAPKIQKVYSSHDRGRLQTTHMKEHAQSQVIQQGERIQFVRLGSHWDAITGLVFGRGVILSAGGGWEYYIAKFSESNLRERNQNQSIVMTNFHQQELKLGIQINAIQCVIVTQIKPFPVRNKLHICKKADRSQLQAEKFELNESWYFMTPDLEAKFDGLADRMERSWFQIIRGEQEYQLWQWALGNQTANHGVFYAEPMPLHTKKIKSLLREYGILQERNWSQVQRELSEVNQVFAYGTMAGQIRKPVTWKAK